MHPPCKIHLIYHYAGNRDNICELVPVKPMEIAVPRYLPHRRPYIHNNTDEHTDNELADIPAHLYGESAHIHIIHSGMVYCCMYAVAAAALIGR